MAYRITIEEVLPAGNEAQQELQLKRYEQTVDTLDLRRVIDAINYRKRDYSKRMKKGDAA